MIDQTFESKLHCITCGKKRLTHLMITFPNEKGETGVAFVRTKNLEKHLKQGTLPNGATTKFPTSGLISKCTVCSSITFYDIIKNKLVAQC